MAGYASKKGLLASLACAGSRSGGIFFDGDEADDKQHIELLKEVFPLHDERPLLFSVIPQQFPPPGLNRFSNF
ncbi:hypothetical protein AB6809_31165 [Paraburkholderia sp. RCC_158]|uniref:hypothetical protein n=1 Tax=Paraburkholderia sp. RCC_158 TaxID=3239220 RepID=UPI003523C1E7